MTAIQRARSRCTRRLATVRRVAVLLLVLLLPAASGSAQSAPRITVCIEMRRGCGCQRRRREHGVIARHGALVAIAHRARDRAHHGIITVLVRVIEQLFGQIARIETGESRNRASALAVETMTGEASIVCAAGASAERDRFAGNGSRFEHRSAAGGASAKSSENDGAKQHADGTRYRRACSS